MLTPWKSATSTLHARLETYNESPYARFFAFNPLLQRVVHQHLTYTDFQALPESLTGYFGATFIRNPYDRAYAGFIQLQRDYERFPGYPYPSTWIKTSVMNQLASNWAQLVAADFDFDKWFALIEEHQIFENGRNPTFPLYPAHYWTGIEREQRLDFIGRVESFEDDFDELCRRVGITDVERKNDNVSEPPRSPERPNTYRYVDRMSKASIDKINSLFRLDFELFGYPTV